MRFGEVPLHEQLRTDTAAEKAHLDVRRFCAVLAQERIDRGERAACGGTQCCVAAEATAALWRCHFEDGIPAMESLSKASGGCACASAHVLGPCMLACVPASTPKEKSRGKLEAF